MVTREAPQISIFPRSPNSEASVFDLLVTVRFRDFPFLEDWAVGNLGSVFSDPSIEVVVSVISDIEGCWVIGSGGIAGCNSLNYGLLRRAERRKDV